jgi:hypothetical protein
MQKVRCRFCSKYVDEYNENKMCELCQHEHNTIFIRVMKRYDILLESRSDR